MDADARPQLEGFIERFLPEIATQGRAALDFFWKRHPAANLLVYDNYNALAIGFSANRKRAGIIFSVTLYPRWVSVFFSRGAEIDDPNGILEGTGSKIRHIKLRDGITHEHPDVLAQLDQAIAIAEPPLAENGSGELIIQSISANRRPRRP